MRCKIADLITEIPEVGSIAPYLKGYLYHGEKPVDIVIDPRKFDPKANCVELPYNAMVHFETARQFFMKLLDFGGFYLHSSSVEYEGKAYLFSAVSGTGKSTHTKLWKQTFGEDVRIFNDDKTPLRYLDDTWYAYGAPWCGKENININMRVPVAGICFLKQAPENKIRRLSPQEAAAKIISQTIYKYQEVERLDLMLNSINRIVEKIPVFELENRPEPDAARLSYETMYRAAEKMGL